MEEIVGREKCKYEKEKRSYRKGKKGKHSNSVEGDPEGRYPRKKKGRRKGEKG